MRYHADPTTRIGTDGLTLIGGSPVRVMRLAAAAAPVLGGLASVLDPATLTPAGRRLLGRLVEVGAAHPRPGRAEIRAASSQGIGVVVPVRDRPADLARCLAALSASGLTRLVVVDDGSIDPGAHAAVAAEFDAAVIRHERPLGPAAARGAGCAALDTPLVAFVDSDVEVTPGWWRPLAVLLEDDGLGGEPVAMAAPRLRAAPPPDSDASSVLARYEEVASPLDLGPRASPVRRGAPVAYVPAATLLVRRAALDAVGGFDPTLEVGEDVDLVWRLADAGYRVRYEPTAVVHHAVRPSWPATLMRRVEYGRSAAALDLRHEHAVPALVTTPWTLAAGALLAARRPVIAAGVAAVSAARLADRLSSVPSSGLVAGRLVAAGHAHGVRQMARALVRPWWPVTLLTALVSRRSRTPIGTAVLATVGWEWWRRGRPMNPVVFGAAFLADEMAYSAGVWSGSRRARHYGALMIRLASDPTDPT